MISTTTILGTIGAALILLAFVMNQLHKWRDTDVAYDITNFLGGSVLLVYSWQIGSYPFIFINFVWAALALHDVIAHYTNRSKKFPRKQI